LLGELIGFGDTPIDDKKKKKKTTLTGKPVGAFKMAITTTFADFSVFREHDGPILRGLSSGKRSKTR
jgi:hypothetical protein